MKLGAYIFATDYTIAIDELARELEQRGYESLFVPEHTHIPASRRSPWPGGADLPEEYWHTLDPFVGLAAAAAVTTKLRIGTAICLLTERDPIVTAKEVATLDHVSNGRFEFGIGAGWNAEEMANHGTAFDSRFRLMVDRCKAMQAIWSQEEASYSGEFTKIDAIWSYPKPVQKPWPPVLLGGETKYTLRRVMDFCDGWMPRGRGFDEPEPEMARFRQFAEEAERDLDSLSVTLFDAKPDKDYLSRCHEQGIGRALLQLPPKGREDVLRVLDELQPLLD